MNMNRDLTAVSREKGMKVLKMIWGAMIFSVGIYAAIALVVQMDPGNVSSVPLVAALAAISGGLFFTQVKLHQNLDDENLFPRILDLGSWGLKPEVAEQLKTLQMPERGVQLILQAHVVFSIVIWAMAEAVAVFGLVLSLITGERHLMGIFGSVALIQLLWFRPRDRAFDEQLERWGKYVQTGRGRVQSLDS